MKQTFELTAETIDRVPTPDEFGPHLSRIARGGIEGAPREALYSVFRMAELIEPQSWTLALELRRTQALGRDTQSLQNNCDHVAAFTGNVLSLIDFPTSRKTQERLVDLSTSLSALSGGLGQFRAGTLQISALQDAVKQFHHAMGELRQEMQLEFNPPKQDLKGALPPARSLSDE